VLVNSFGQSCCLSCYFFFFVYYFRFLEMGPKTIYTQGTPRQRRDRASGDLRRKETQLALNVTIQKATVLPSRKKGGNSPSRWMAL